VPTKEQLYLLCADAILLLHLAFAAFVVVGLLLIWVGRFYRWSFVRNFYFRLAHLLAMGAVVFESLLGFPCPLTTWEDWFRLLAGNSQPYEGPCVQYWVHRLLFCDVTQTTCTILYCLFFLLMLASLWYVPPHGPAHRNR
jgi:hypothetical protein